MTQRRMEAAGATGAAGGDGGWPEGIAGSRGLRDELVELRGLVARLDADLRSGRAQRLPGSACFLEDGRVLCRERSIGDSRFPYGSEGLHFWINASGRMYGNNGLFFIFLPTQENADPPVALFLGVRDGEREAFTPYSLLPTPYMMQSEDAVLERYTVLGPDAARFVMVTAEVCALVRVFVDQTVRDCPRIAFSTYLENLADAELDLYFSSYMNPFCRHQFGETSEDRWFKRIEADGHDPIETEAQGAHVAALPAMLISVNEDVSRFRSITNHGLVRRSMTLWRPRDIEHGHVRSAMRVPVLTSTTTCTAQRAYLGSMRRGLASAAFLTSGRFEEAPQLTVFNDNAIAGDLTRFKLPGRAAAQFDSMLSLPADAAALEQERTEQIDAGLMERRYAMVRQRIAAAEGRLSMRVTGRTASGIPDRTLNHFLPYLKKQVAICAETKGYMQPSPNSLIGFRDVFQAIEGQLLDRPDVARGKMREALGYVLVDGRCPRQYSLTVNGAPGAADLREFIDQGAWAISAVSSYVAATGDHKFLDQVLGYHRIRGDHAHALCPADERDSVLEHLIRVLDYLARHRDPRTGLVRILYGDWNDAVDGLGTTREPGKSYGSGVSVMASLQVYQNCAEMMELIRRYRAEAHSDLAADYERLRESLAQSLMEHAVVRRGRERRIVHGWGDERSYHVGSFRDCDGRARDSLTSNAFWVLSGMLDRDPSMREAVLEAFGRLDSRYGLKTFEPGFGPDCPEVGRVGKLPIGTAENAATYVHATAFGIAALFMMNEPREAWRQIEKILPFGPHQTGLSHTSFVMPNSYVHNPELNLTGQNMNDWQTGSSNVLLKLLVRYVFGFQPGFEELRAAPAEWSPFEGFDFRATAQGRDVRFVMCRSGVRERRMRLNQEPLGLLIDGRSGLSYVSIPYERLSDHKENLVQIDDPSHA